MLRSSNAQQMQQNFTIKVEKQPDGRFKATSPNAKGVEASGSTVQVASSQLNKKLQEMVSKGELS